MLDLFHPINAQAGGLCLCDFINILMYSQYNNVCAVQLLHYSHLCLHNDMHAKNFTGLYCF